MKSLGMTSCSRTFTFDSGHRVVGHQGKCRHLHGHTYKAEVNCTAAFNNKLGMVIDFSEIKSRVGGWIEQCLDHNLILNPQDPLLKVLNACRVETFQATRKTKSSDTVFMESEPVPPRDIHDRIPFVMPGTHPNPTAENIARVILEKACEILAPVAIVCWAVRLWETPNCFADYYHPDFLSAQTAADTVLKELNRVATPSQ